MSWGQLVPMSRPAQAEGFFSGRSSVDDWFRHKSFAATEQGRVATWLALDTTGKTVGFVALKSIGLVEEQEANSKARRYFSAGESGILIAQMGLAVSMQGQGLGGKLLAQALQKCLESADIAPCRVIVLDAAEESLVPFYERFGFRPIGPGQLRMYQSLASVRKAFAAI